jgi:16S rRNA (uracil1498-N3)-methyltransferase
VSRPRFWVPGLPAEGLVDLPEFAARHARDACRLGPGDALSLFDGAGREVEAAVEDISRRRVRVLLGEPLVPRPESPLFAELCVPPLKADRFEWALEKAVELGAAAVVPLATERGDAAARRVLHGARPDRWLRVMAAAAEQCGRATLPRLAPAVRLPELLAVPFAGARVVLAETAPARPLRDCVPAGATRVQLIVGPAGGFTPAEREAARRAGCAEAGLGPRILRAETAAIAALALLQAERGDLG